MGSTILYRIGRELTTKRHVQKVTGVDYEALLAQEHVNRCRDIIQALKSYFHIDTVRGVPFSIPSVALNFMLVGRCVKKAAKTTKKYKEKELCGSAVERESKCTTLL